MRTCLQSKGKSWIFSGGLLPLFILLAGSIALLAGVPAANAAEEYRIGITTSLKMEAGNAMITSGDMAAEEINAKGGILGRKIKIFSADDESNPEKGINALKRLVERDKVNILVGAAVSGVLLAQMDYLQQYNILFMNTGASSPLIAKKVADNYEKYKYHFRDTINAADMAKALCEDEIGYFLKLGYKKFAILAEDAAWNRGLVDYLKKSIPSQGGTVTTAINFDTATIDFSPIFSQIASSGAEFAVPLFAHTDTIALYKQWNEMKAPFRMGGFSNPGMHADYWKKTGGACISEVNIAWGPVVRANISPKSVPWFDSYAKKFGYSPHGVATTNYDGIYLIAEAIQRAQSVETAALIKALEEIDYVGVCGRYVFNKKNHDAIYGDVNYVPFLVTQWQEGGKFEVIWPDKLATGKFQNPPWLKK